MKAHVNEPNRVAIQWRRNKINLTEIEISKEISYVIVDRGYKASRLDMFVTEGESYLKLDVLGDYEIYKATSDFSHAELLLIVEPKIPKEIMFVYSRHNYVRYGDFFLNANQQLQRWCFAESSNNKFHIYKEAHRVALNEEIKLLLL